MTGDRNVSSIDGQRQRIPNTEMSSKRGCKNRDWQIWSKTEIAGDRNDLFNLALNAQLMLQSVLARVIYDLDNQQFLNRQ